MTNLSGAAARLTAAPADEYLNGRIFFHCRSRASDTVKASYEPFSTPRCELATERWASAKKPGHEFSDSDLSVGRRRCGADTWLDSCGQARVGVATVTCVFSYRWSFNGLTGFSKFCRGSRIAKTTLKMTLRKSRLRNAVVRVL